MDWTSWGKGFDREVRICKTNYYRIENEDNEIMRPDVVMPNASAIRTYAIGVDY